MRILRWPGHEAEAFLRRLMARGEGPSQEIEEEVRRILEAVRSRGDEALWEFGRRFDGASLDAATVRVAPQEIEAAQATLPARAAMALWTAATRIEAFHRKQVRESWFAAEADGTLLGQVTRPLERVGIYVPGGSAAYPSTVLMTAIPAKVAGVGHVLVCTPVGPDGRVNPAILAAAGLAGVREVYKVGGAHAIAAMAYGTASIPRVDKIVGPGNRYVTTAKRLLFGVVGIDMLAGPSEVLILADETARAPWVAADLLAQAEHDPAAAAILVTTSESLAEAVAKEVEVQLTDLPRREIARAAVEAHGGIFAVGTLAAASTLANLVAPEHLELCVRDPWGLLSSISHAGAIFLGATSPEAAGDYLAGPSHVLPTGGTARFASPLSVEDFQKRSSLVAIGPRLLGQVGDAIIALAELEGLAAHARSIAIRREHA